MQSVKKFVYKNENSMKKMHEFYDKTLASLDVPYSEACFDTSKIQEAFGWGFFIGEGLAFVICALAGLMVQFIL